MEPTEDPADQRRLTLLGSWRLEIDGSPVSLPRNARRLIAFLALQGPLSRPHVAGNLWPEARDEHALGNLRATLSRLQRQAPGTLDSDGERLAVAEGIVIDAERLATLAQRVSRGIDEVVTPAELDSLLKAGELLPGWYDDWVSSQRERLNQLRLHAVEHLSRQFGAQGRFVEALDAALTALNVEPLRESPHRIVVEVHLAEGNTTEALRHFFQYRDMVRRELGLEPSSRMLRLVAPFLNRAPGRR